MNSEFYLVKYRKGGHLKQKTGAPAGATASCSRSRSTWNGSFYTWKKKSGGMEIFDARKLRSLEDENRRLKKLVADLSLDVQMLKEVNSKKW